MVGATVAIGCAIVSNGVSRITCGRGSTGSRGGIDVVPAVGQHVVVDGAACGTGDAVEVLDHRHIGILPDTALGSSGSNIAPGAVVGVAALGADIELILGRVVQTVHHKVGVVGRFDGSSSIGVEARQTINNFPACGGGRRVLGPAQRCAGLGGSRHSKCRGSPAGRIGVEAYLCPRTLVVATADSAYIDVVVSVGIEGGGNIIIEYII